ncbi:hypothetical protein ACLOJK_035823 [Asimina triloba]
MESAQAVADGDGVEHVIQMVDAAAVAASDDGGAVAAAAEETGRDEIIPLLSKKDGEKPRLTIFSVSYSARKDPKRVEDGRYDLANQLPSCELYPGNLLVQARIFLRNSARACGILVGICIWSRSVCDALDWNHVARFGDWLPESSLVSLMHLLMENATLACLSSHELEMAVCTASHGL